MSEARDPRFQAFDPFGEPVEATRACAPVPAVEARSRRVAVAVFWGLALLFVAGRVHFADPVATHEVAAAQTGTAPAPSAVR